MPRGKKPRRRPPWRTIATIAAIVTVVGGAIKEVLDVIERMLSLLGGQ